MEKVKWILLMEVLMKETLSKVYLMDKEYIKPKMVLPMKVNGKLVGNMEKVH